MKLLVVSHKICWSSSESASGYATNGGFPFQMRALSELFDETKIVVPCTPRSNHAGDIPLNGHNLSVLPLSKPSGQKFWRKIGLLPWLLRNSAILFREIWRSDLVHTPIPSDIGTIAMVLTLALRKPLLVRHCGNWLVQRTAAERLWKWTLETFAGGRNVVLATGGTSESPSKRNPNIRWIFSTSLTEQELSECSMIRTHLPGEEPKLIIICRQEKGKGTELIIDSLRLITKRFPKATLDVVGDGAALNEFKNNVEAKGLNEKVVFHGNVSHAKVLQLLKRADLFCFPTASEGFPKTVLEALACGLPVITTRVSVLPQLIGTGCGHLIEETTPEAIDDAVWACLSDEEHYRDMSAQAITTASQYSLERWRDAIGEFLEVACGPLRSHPDIKGSTASQYVLE